MHDKLNRLGVTGSADNVVKHKPSIISKIMLMVQPVSVIKISAAKRFSPTDSSNFIVGSYIK